MGFAVKPSSFIAAEQTTIDRDGKEIKINISGKDTPCICSGIVAVVGAMPAMVLPDHHLIQERISLENSKTGIAGKIRTIHIQTLLILAEKNRFLSGLFSQGRCLSQIQDREWMEAGNNLGLSENDIERLFEILT